MTTDILDHWHFPYEPRKNQITALKWLQEQEAKYLLLEIPVGGGKSNLAMTYASWLKATQQTDYRSSFIITPQKILQEQYERSFKPNPRTPIQVLYGKSNYKCDSKLTTCDVGSLIKPKCHNCAHLEAKNIALRCENVVLNYTLALTSFAYTDFFPPRNLMVFDECHNIENHLVGFDALEISNRRSKKYKVPFKTQTKIGEALKWIKSIYFPQLRKKLRHLQIECDDIKEKPPKELTSADLSKLREKDRLATHLDEVELMNSRKELYVKENFVLVNSIDKFEFKRLSGAYSFGSILSHRAQKFLFMSSTILDKDNFCSEIGVDPSEAAMLSLGSEFPVENRPVYFKPTIRMNKDWNEKKNVVPRRKAIADLITILNLHESESGLIHTGNFAIANWLVEKLSSKIPHRIYDHNPGSQRDRNSAINAFMLSDSPSILVSPSSTEGLDLKEDLGRFAIIMKVPFGSLGDQWIKRKMEISNKWYRRKALIDIIQGGGRIVRSSDDTGTVYILDEAFSFLFKQSRNMVPAWWMEAYHQLTR